jgi:uncharacterized protein
MFSVQKLAVFAIIIAALWLGFRLVGKMDKGRKEAERRVRPSWRHRLFAGRSRAGASRDGNLADVDMVACRVCGDYVASVGARSCGRPNCPYAPVA